MSNAFARARVKPTTWCSRGEARWAQDGKTALYLAVEGGHVPVVNALMRVAGTDVNAKDNVRCCGFDLNHNPLYFYLYLFMCAGV